MPVQDSRQYKRKFKGIWIPSWLWFNKELTPLEKFFYLEIDSLAATANGCFAGNKHFADLFEVSKKHASVIINNLVQKGWVKTAIDKQKSNRRYMAPLSRKIGLGYPEKCGGGIPKKTEHNNTNTNVLKECTHKNKGIIFSPDEILALELKKTRRLAVDYEVNLHQILPARTNAERTTYNRLREHLTALYTKGQRDIFNRVINIAKEVRTIEVNNRRGLFIKKCKKETGFRGRGRKLL